MKKKELNIGEFVSLAGEIYTVFGFEGNKVILKLNNGNKLKKISLNKLVKR